MTNKVLTTPVDDLVEIIKKQSPISITSLQKKIKMPLSIIEKWLVILEEYKVVKTTYKGFEGFVEFNTKKEEKKKKEIDVEDLKNVFIQKCKEKKLSFEQIQSIWPKFTQEYTPQIKDEFISNAKKKGYNNVKINQAWIKFEKDLKRF